MNVTLEKNTFLPLIRDAVSKYLFINEITRVWFIKIIKHYTGIDLTGLKLIRNEINTEKKKHGGRVDILLEDEKKKIIYNVEFNGSNEKYFIKRNNRYVNLLAAEVNRYDNKEEYKICQININNYYCNKKRKTRHNHIELKDEENDVMLENIEYFNIYIPKIIKTCYHRVDKEMNIFICESFEELEKYAKSKEGKLIMEKVKGILEQEGFMDFFDYDEDQKIMMRDARAYGEEIGEKRGAIKEREKTARNMLRKKYDPKDVAEVTGLSASKIKSFML